MIIKVKLSSSASPRKEILVDSSKTIKSVLEENGIGYTTASICLDGETLGAASLNNTFDSFNVTESCYVAAVTKTTNA